MARPAGTADCYTCGVNLAGNAVGGPSSAFCSSCQPRDQRPVIGSAWMCAVCGVNFGTLRGFDAHQAVDYSAPRAVTCLDPAALGLIRDDRGVFQTPAGLARRERSRGLVPGRPWAALEPV
jgi:hypothetical protein